MADGGAGGGGEYPLIQSRFSILVRLAKESRQPRRSLESGFRNIMFADRCLSYLGDLVGLLNL